MKTQHQSIFADSRQMKYLLDESVDSPPYPRIEMWDELFFLQSPKVKKKF